MYRFFDIGSGKPGIAERERIRHHLIDIVDPDYPFTAGEFCREALKACGGIYRSGKYPLFVGGTGLYIDSLMGGISEIPDVDREVRNGLLREMEEKGLRYLYGDLEKLDHEFAARIHPNDTQRILRGLEVLKATGRPITSYYECRNGHESESTLYIGLYDDGDSMKKRIEQRVVRMMESGLVDEVRKIRSMGYSPNLRPMKSIGYLEVNRFLDGEYSLDEAAARIAQSTKKYAKRQMTWFRKNKRVNWFKTGNDLAVCDLIEEWLRTVGSRGVYPWKGDDKTGE